MILNNISIYLAGPINFASDDGIGWRQHFKQQVLRINPTITFFDPCDKPKNLGSEVGVEKKLVQEWKRAGDWDRITQYVKTYRRYDLRGIDKSDLFVINVDTSMHMCGSYNELHFAEQAHKPRFAILPQGKANAPDWLFSQIRHTDMFESIESCVERIESLNSGVIPLDDRWVLWS